MCSTFSRAAGLGAAMLAMAGCTTHPTAAYPRPSLPLPEAIAARYRIPDAFGEEALVPIGQESGVRFFRGRLTSDSERVEFHYLVPESDRPRPTVLLLPILAGGEILMWMVAWDLAQRGYVVAWTERVDSAMSHGQRAPEMETLFRRTVIQNRMLLAWLRDEDAVDSALIGLIGISMGGIIGGVLLAMEPDLAGGALCLAGGNLPDLILKSSESRVESWRDWRFQEDGLGPHELHRELSTHLLSDPARLGAYIQTDRVMLVSALFDGVVPLENQDLLWESLGRPHRLQLPLGHYTSALGIGRILDHVDGFIQDRFDATRLARPGPVPGPEPPVPGRH